MYGLAALYRLILDFRMVANGKLTGPTPLLLVVFYDSVLA